MTKVTTHCFLQFQMKTDSIYKSENWEINWFDPSLWIEDIIPSKLTVAWSQCNWELWLRYLQNFFFILQVEEKNNKNVESCWIILNESLKDTKWTELIELIPSRFIYFIFFLFFIFHCSFFWLKPYHIINAQLNHKII